MCTKSAFNTIVRLDVTLNIKFAVSCGLYIGYCNNKEAILADRCPWLRQDMEKLSVLLADHQ